MSDGVSLGKSRVISSSGLALKVATKDHGSLWIPRSVIHDDSEVFDDGDNNEGNLVVMEWFAEKENLT